MNIFFKQKTIELLFSTSAVYTEEIKFLTWPGQICGFDTLKEKRDGGQHSWSRLLSVLCLHKHDKTEIATKGLMIVCSVDICTTCYDFHELKCKRKVEIISGRRKCDVLRGLVLQAMVKVTILAGFPGTRVPEYPLRTLIKT